MTLQMGIVKVEVKVSEFVKAIEVFRENPRKAFDEIANEIKSSMTECFNKLLQAEFDLFIGSTDLVSNKRNGFIERDFSIKGIGSLKLRVPRDRKGKFNSIIIPKNAQMDFRLKEDLAILHLSGISNRTLSLISKRILGIEVSAQTVHNSLSVLESKALAWLDRDITKKYWALFIDGTNFKIQRRDSVEKEPTLVVLGIDDRNCFSILAMQPGQKDDAASWGVVFDDLIKRGLDPKQVQIGVMDGLPGLEEKFKEYFVNSLTARCWVHAKRNAILKTPKRLADSFEDLLSKVMYAGSESNARAAFANLKRQMSNDASRAVNCIEKDLDSLLGHYRFEEKFWRTLKTTNPIERINKELKRRFKSMESIGENTHRILTAFTALRMEYNWQATAVDNPKLNHLKQIKLNSNKSKIEDVLENLIH